jgi:predicted MFS family arabinose efflux permease
MSAGAGPGTRAASPAAAVPAAGKGSALRRLAGSSAVSMLGSRMTAIACPLLVLRMTGSPAAAGWAMLAATAPAALAYLPAGALVDRGSPGRILLWAECGRGAAIGVVVAAVALGRASVALLVAATVAEGVLRAFSALAELACVRALAGGQLPSAVAVTEARGNAALLAGRPLGALLFGIAPALPFAGDLLTFAYSAATLAALRGWLPGSQEAPARATRLAADIREGLRWVRHHPFARVMLVVGFTATLTAQAAIMVFLARAHAVRLPALDTGVVLSAAGAGGLLGSAAGPWLVLRAGRYWAQAQVLAWLLALAAMWLQAAQPLVMAPALALMGLAGAAGNIAQGTCLMSEGRPGMLARVMSLSELAGLVAGMAGAPLGGILAQDLGARGAVACLLLLMALPVLALAASRRREARS